MEGADAWLYRTCWLEIAAEIQFKFQGSKDTGFENSEQIFLVNPLGSPAVLCPFRVSHKSQVHIAVYSDLITKKWAQMTNTRNLDDK